MDLTGLIETGGSHPVVLFVIAFVLGALHGLEPGHSKTMIAAYIIAVRGTAFQAMLLGISAALSHSLIVWILAAVALSVGDELIAETAEPYFMVVSGTIIMVIAAWMAGRMTGERAAQPAFALAHGLPGGGSAAALHDHDHDHDHGHGQGHGHSHHHDHDHHHDDHGGGDAHARAHAAELRVRLASGRTGNWQTILFGLTGGLIPCPAAITVLIVCLHLGSVWLGVGLVSGFSLGLGVTLVTVGMVAAWGTRAVARRSAAFDRWTKRVPLLSSLLIGCVGIAMMAGGMASIGG